MVNFQLWGVFVWVKPREDSPPEDKDTTTKHDILPADVNDEREEEGDSTTTLLKAFHFSHLALVT